MTAEHKVWQNVSEFRCPVCLEGSKNMAEELYLLSAPFCVSEDGGVKFIVQCYAGPMSLVEFRCADTRTPT